MSEDLIYFSKNLIFIRKLVGVTQAGLAEKLGIKANTISNYEKEVTTPDFKLLVKLCKLFCLPADLMLNTLLTSANLEAQPDWLKNVRRNFNLNDVDLPPSSVEITSAEANEQLYVKQLLQQLEQKDELIMRLNRRIGRLEYEIELLQKEDIR